MSLKRAVDVSTTGVLPSTPDLSHVLRLHQRFLTRPTAGRPWKRDPTTPHAQPLPGLTHIRFGLIRFRSPLLPESRLFSLPAGTEMFHFPAFPPHALCVQAWVTAHDDCRVSPFGNPRIKAWLTAPRGLSWPPTSFIGSWCQGIHRAPLKTWPQMLASTVQFSNNTQQPVPEEETTPSFPIIVADKTLACSLRTQQCTDITTAEGHSGPSRAVMTVSVPPMSTTGLRVNPKWLCLAPPAPVCWSEQGVAP